MRDPVLSVSKYLFVSENLDVILSLFRIPAEAHNDVYESTENVYEDITTSSGKNKAKSDGGKKRKGPPKSEQSFQLSY